MLHREGISKELLIKETNKYLEKIGVDCKELKSRDSAISEYLESKGFSFNKNKDEGFEGLKEGNAGNGIKKLLDLYGTDIEDMPPEIRAKLNIKIENGKELSKRDELNSFDGLKGNIFSMLKFDEKTGTDLYKILEKELGMKIEEIKDRVESFTESCRNLIEAAKSDKKFLAHGDLGIESIHSKNDEVKFSGWDMATISDNEALALIFDYGNLRGRAAGNPDIQKDLDKAIMDEFGKRGNPELGKAIIDLATLRTSFKFYKYSKEGSVFKEGQVDNHIDNIKKFFSKEEGVEAKA